MSIHNLAYQRFLRQAGNQDRGYALRAHQIFRRAREWQFDVFPHGKHTKHRVISSHLKVLCLALVWFDPSGSGSSIFPALKNLLARVNTIETQRGAGGKVRVWNMRKLYRYLRVLENSKLMDCEGSRHNRKPRNRFLHPELLRKVQPGRRESVSRRPPDMSLVDSNVSLKDSRFYESKSENPETSARRRPRGFFRSRFQSNGKPTSEAQRRGLNAIYSGDPIIRNPAKTGVINFDTGEMTPIGGKYSQGKVE